MGTAKDPGRANRCARFVAASVGFLALLGASYLALAAKPSPTLSDLRERTNQELERLLAERDATSAIARWRHDRAQSADLGDEADEEAKAADGGVGLPPIGIYDGIYSASVTTRRSGRLSAFRIEVRNGVGSGMESRFDCGLARFSIAISPGGEVSGMGQIFSPTCLKIALPIAGRAIGGTLQLSFGGESVVLIKPED